MYMCAGGPSWTYCRKSRISIHSEMNLFLGCVKFTASEPSTRNMVEVLLFDRIIYSNYLYSWYTVLNPVTNMTSQSIALEHSTLSSFKSGTNAALPSDSD